MTPDPTAPSAECPSTGTLRTHLDHPAPVVEAHLDECEACRDVIVGVARDAGTARRLITGLTSDEVPGEGRRSDETRTAVREQMVTEGQSVRSATPSRGLPGTARRAGRHRERRPSRRVAVPSLGVALVLVLALALVPGAGTAVAQFLDTFRGEQLQVVQVDSEAFGDLAGLAALGDVERGDMAEPVMTDDAAEAAQVAGFSPTDAGELIDALAAASGRPDAVDDVPSSVVSPSYVASPGGTATLTLRAQDGNGVPADLDGVALVVRLPPAVATVLTDQATAGGSPLDGIPLLVAGTAGAVEIAADGAPLADVRAFLLGREELPDELRDQLAGIDDWRHTLPIPVPSAGMPWDDITVDGHAGVALGDDSGLGAAVIWQDGGLLHGLAGPQPRGVLIDLAGR